MCRKPQRVILLLLISLVSVASCGAYVDVPLVNGNITEFTTGVASGWTSFTAGLADPAPQFHENTASFRSPPCAQGVSGIDSPQAPGTLFGCGITQQVNAVAGRVYLLTGYQDLYDPTFMPPPARRYAHFFGIGCRGDESPPAPFTMGGVDWMDSDRWFYNDMAGNSTQVGGMHRCMAAWPARSDRISIWTGIHVYGDAPAYVSPTVFTTDEFRLYEFEIPVHAVLQNPGFETVENLTPGLDPNDVSRITLPVYWVPIGGGIGQKESYYTDAYGKRSGTAGLRIYNHRGCLMRGVMQRVNVQPGCFSVTFSVWVRANRLSGTLARIGIDPAGGDDIRSPGIVWSSYTRTDEAWEQVAVTAPCSKTPVTLFLCAANEPETTGSVHYADFDDASLSFQVDSTPPEPFEVIAESPSTLLGFLSAQIAPAPRDPETGIALVEYAVGTAPGAEDVRPFTISPDPAFVSAAGLWLTPGQNYYITVRATNGAGLSTTATSNPVLCAPGPYPYVWRHGGHLSQTSYNADNVRLTAGPDGRVYAVWRESDDITWNGSDSCIMLRDRIDGRWSTPRRVNSERSAWWPDVAAYGDCAVVSYLTPGDEFSNDLHVAVGSSASGFADSLVMPGAAAFPRLASYGSAGWVIGCRLDAAANPPGGQPSLVFGSLPWWVERVPGGQPADSRARVSVAVCGSTVHCLWGCLDADGQCLYYSRRHEQGLYSVPILIARGTNCGSIAASPNGQVSIAYVREGGVWFVRSSDGQDFDRPQYLGLGSYPCVAEEAGELTHVLYFAPSGMRNEHGVEMVVPVHLVKDASGWSMPQAVCAPSCTSGVWAQEPGNLAVDPSGGLHFAWSNNPHDPGWRNGEFYGCYWIDYHTTTQVQQTESEIAAAKLWGDDLLASKLGYPPCRTVTLAAKEVTAAGTFRFPATTGGQTVWKSVPCFYIQEADRSSGIRVIAGDAQDSPLPSIGLRPGDLATVTGIISTIDGERTVGYLTPDGRARGVTYSLAGKAAAPAAPLCLAVKSLGGAAIGPTPGPTGAPGANNVGLLVRVVGTVAAVSTDERGVKVLYIDDGSNVSCGPARGCKVYAPGASFQPGDVVAVTGVSSVEIFDPDPDAPGDETVIRVVMPRDTSSLDSFN